MADLSRKRFSVCPKAAFGNIVILMRQIIFVLALALAAFGQTTTTRIPPDEAAKHLISKPSATYPPMAEAARIQGNVILEVRVDEWGAASVHRLVYGHPFLAPAAILSVNGWKYQPFEVDGKPAAAITFVMVTFGNPTNHDAEDRVQVLFQHNFWTAEESAQAALGRGDYSAAEQQLNKARDLLAPVSDNHPHRQESWQWTTTMGHLAMAQQKHDEAEQYYEKALALRQADDKNAPETAATLANLGNLYAEEKRYDLARDHASRSLAIYQKNFKRAGSKNPGDRQTYGRAIAYQSWMLSKLALQQGNHIEAGKQCHTVLDFQTFLSAVDHDSIVSACEQEIRNRAAK
jgi:tetratricopeptide (TPR) repeat protein